MSQARLNRSNLRILGIIQQPVYQAGIQAIVKKMHCTFIGAPTNVPDALKLLRVHQPCIVLLDTLCDQIDVLMAMRLIRKRFPEAPVILLLLEERDEWLVQAMRVGVAACLARDVDEETLKESIQRVGQGEYPIENTVLTRPRLVSYLRRMICEPDTDESEKPSMSPCLLTQERKPFWNIWLRDGKINA
jgi:DNA-binding NarL/FixJ family response regulator